MDAELRKSPLWTILVETARSLPLYKQHRNYVRDNLQANNPQITADEVAERMRISLGEALVILSELEKA